MIAELYMYPGRISRQTLASRRGIMDPYKTPAWCHSQTGLDGNDFQVVSRIRARPIPLDRPSPVIRCTGFRSNISHIIVVRAADIMARNDPFSTNPRAHPHPF